MPEKENGKKTGRTKELACPTLSRIVKRKEPEDLPCFSMFLGGKARNMRLGMRTAALIRRLAG
ncbi:MAG: hypothetical protein ABSG38_12950 [Spirochaetia bacterium]